MKKVVVMFVSLFVLIFGAYAETGKVKGVVQYKYNDYVGFKTDVGAEFYVVSVSKASNVDVETWEKYEVKTKEYMKYLEYKNDPEIPSEYLRLFTSWKDADKKVLDELDGKCLEQSLAIKESCEDFDIIDESGKYELTLPYGEYYILFISKNRERPTVTEITGRKIVKKIKVDKPATLLSIEFGY